MSFNEFYLCLEQWIRQKMSTHHPAARGSHLALSDSSPHEALLSMPGQEDDEVHDDDIVDDDEDEEEGEEPLTRAQVPTRPGTHGVVCGEAPGALLRKQAAASPPCCHDRPEFSTLVFELACHETTICLESKMTHTMKCLNTRVG